MPITDTLDLARDAQYADSSHTIHESCHNGEWYTYHVSTDHENKEYRVLGCCPQGVANREAALMRRAPLPWGTGAKVVVTHRNSLKLFGTYEATI